MKNLKHYLLFLAIIAISACSKTTTLRLAQNYDSSLEKSSHAIILPPIVEVSIIDVSGKATRNHDYEYQLEHTIIDVLIPKLRSKGYTARLMTRREIHDNKLSRYALASTEEYQNQINKLYSPVLWDEKKAFAIEASLTNGIQELKDATNADLIIFVEYYGKSNTTGANMKNLALGLLLSIGSSSEIEAGESVSLRLAIVDATNNKILWSNFARGDYSIFSFDNMSSLEKVDKERLNKLFDNILSQLPSK